MEPQLIGNLIPELTAKLTTTQASKTSSSGWQALFNAYDASLLAAKAAVEAFVADMESGAFPYWLTLTGANGCGKTFLATQAFREGVRINPGHANNNPIWPPDWATKGKHTYDDHRPYCTYLDEKDFARRLRAGEYDLPDDLGHDYLVVLDELGFARDPSAFVADGIARLAQGRRDKWTVWITNLTLAEISERIDARVSSRLIRDLNKLVTITAGDYALRKRDAVR